MSNEDGSSPAFPRDGRENPCVVSPQVGLSQRAYAAIHLRVPDSGLPWLDEMIVMARREDTARAVLQAKEVAAEMFAQGRKG